MVVFELTGKGSVIEQDIFPPIVLDENKNYVVAVLSVVTFNSIPNVHEGMNKFYWNEEGISKETTIPTGSYELVGINQYLRSAMGANVGIFPNKNTLTAVIHSEYDIDFSQPNSIRPLLGFGKRIIPAGTNESEMPVNILNVNTISVECNIASGSYKNGKPSRAIYQLVIDVPSGYKIISYPQNILFFPIQQRYIDRISLKLTDQDNKLVDFRGESVTIRLQIKQEGDEDHL